MTLDPGTVERLLDELFPPDRKLASVSLPNLHWEDELIVPPAEIKWAIREKKNLNIAPESDGFKSALWKRIPVLMKYCQMLYCILQAWFFPCQMEDRRSHVDPKGELSTRGTSQDPPHMLDEVAKTFERIMLHAFSIT